MSNPGCWLAGGIAGAIGVCCYVLAITVPWPHAQVGTSAVLLLASGWPILSIVYGHALYSFVAAERESVSNRLSLLFAIAGFTTVLAMIVVQLAVGAGLAEVTRDLDAQQAGALRRGLRLVDLGLDVAWDMRIGTALFLSGLAMAKRSGLGPAWAIPSMALGIGLIDIGPVIGVFVLLLSTRLALLGRRAKRAAVN